ncbi:MAG: hypothetical protein J5I59_07710 [Saprospiraceae bacterium]|nr:hypothetical protein [Saprospiraceae bacterium]
MRSKGYIHWLPFFGFLFFAHFLQAQIQMEVTPDTNRILLGDRVKLTFTITCEPTIEIKNLVLDSITTLDGFELSHESEWVEKKTQMSKILTKEMILTVFNPGEYDFPKVPYNYIYQGKQKTGYSGQWHLTVLPLNTSSPEIAPNKDIVVDNSFWNLYGNWVIAGLCCLLAILLILYFIRRRKNIKSGTGGLPVEINPAKEAIAALDRLESSNLWKSEDPVPFQTELSDVLRTYLQRVTRIPALHLTSYEIVASLRKAGLSNNIIDITDKALNIADLVKFAKAQSREEINYSFIAKVKALIHETELILQNKTQD